MRSLDISEAARLKIVKRVLGSYLLGLIVGGLWMWSPLSSEVPAWRSESVGSVFGLAVVTLPFALFLSFPLVCIYLGLTYRFAASVADHPVLWSTAAVALAAGYTQLMTWLVNLENGYLLGSVAAVSAAVVFVSRMLLAPIART